MLEIYWKVPSSPGTYGAGVSSDRARAYADAIAAQMTAEIREQYPDAEIDVAVVPQRLLTLPFRPRAWEGEVEREDVLCWCLSAEARVRDALIAKIDERDSELGGNSPR